MIFDYNLITGLNYYTYNNSFVMLDITKIPPILNTEEFLESWKKEQAKLGVEIVDTPPIKDFNLDLPIISNVPYEIFEKRLG